jgi:muramoyltetrapeptide carboxypeptidase LdcA involved in peptidoglycan recycling
MSSTADPAFRKPSRLCAGDRVAVVSPSWGGPALFPAIFDKGLEALNKHLTLQPVEFPTARMSAEQLRQNPKLRADDLNAAFADASIAGIIASIGGDDSIRILKYLNFDLITSHPKFVMGFSDFTTILAFLSQLGNVVFHGPSIMAGLAQLESLGSQYLSHLKEFLFGDSSSYTYHSYPQYSNGYPDWAIPEKAGNINPPVPSPGWQWLQKSVIRTGCFWGGCIEVLEFMKATAFWPQPSFFNDKFLLLETSEEVPTPLQIQRFLRNYGTQTVLDRIQGLIFGRPRGYTDQQRQDLHNIIIDILINEHGRTDIPIVLNFDVGHTDPQNILPFGILAEIDSGNQRIALIEPRWRIMYDGRSSEF